jgi:hypothetical protein
MIVHYGWINDRKSKIIFTLGGRVTENSEKGSLHDPRTHVNLQVSVTMSVIKKVRKKLIHPPRKCK